VSNENGKLIKKLKQSMKGEIDLYSLDSVLKLSVYMGFGLRPEDLKTKKQLNIKKQKLKSILDSCSTLRLTEIANFMNVRIPSQVSKLLVSY